MDVIIYTDGGADPNPGVGGWAALLRYGKHEKTLSGAEEETTNNRMELTAAVEALRALKRPSQVQFHTDSQYLKKGITEWIDTWIAKDWRSKGKAIANADLWKELRNLTGHHEIEWHWVRGHSGDRYNERVDWLAQQARLSISPRAQILEGAPTLYIRASCKGNPGPGGWGAILEIGGETTQANGSESKTTNNRMEIRAAIEGLQLLPPGDQVVVVTTSDYLYQGATKWIHGWRRREWKRKDGREVANLDLWQELDKTIRQHDIHWRIEKGDIGEPSRGLVEAAILASRAVEIEVREG